MGNDTAEPIKARYTIDVDGLLNQCKLGAEWSWNPFDVVLALEDHIRDPRFDLETHCHRCRQYDRVLGLAPDQKKLPAGKHRDYPFPWKPGRQGGTVKEWHTLRPGRPLEADACQMCVFSFLDPIEDSELTPARIAELREAFAQARREVSVLQQRRARENRPARLEMIEADMLTASRRLRQAVDACREAGIPPTWPRHVRSRVMED